jgi:hypothetical protein
MVAAAIGCNKHVVREKTPPDPLLVSKKPVEGKPNLGDPARPQLADPTPPPVPHGYDVRHMASMPGTTYPEHPVKLLAVQAPQE